PRMQPDAPAVQSIDSRRWRASADGEDLVEAVRRARDHMDADELADAACRGCACIGRGLHGGDVAANDRSDQTGVDFLPADEQDVRRLDHRVGGFDHAHESAGLDEAERFAWQFLRHTYGILRDPPARGYG